jgi:hypothetical protein
MRKAGVVAATVAVLTLALVSAGCGGQTAEATRWVTAVEGGQDTAPASGIESKSTAPFKLTGVPCQLRYETSRALALHVYIVPQDEPTKRQSVLDMRNRSNEAGAGAGETAIDVEPGTYYLEILGVSDIFRYHLWVEEQR